MLFYKETPVQEIFDPLFEKEGARVLVKREDLNHQHVSGNKWWKLKYNLEEATRQRRKTLLTFGGPFSNHIFATAAAAHELGFKSIGIIRGEESLPLNPTLTFAKEKGMSLHFISRELYRSKTDPAFVEKLKNQFGDFYLLPEGGTNKLAVKGCRELGEKLLREIDFDCLCLPVGTGGTMAGIVQGLKGEREVIGFSALKGGAFLEDNVRDLLRSESIKGFENWKILTDYHFGGYGKSTKELEDFITSNWQTHHLPLDSVYTAKMMFGVYHSIKKGNFEKGSTILALHTGGFQGNYSFF